MKRTIVFHTLLASVAMALGLASCSSDHDPAPDDTRYMLPEAKALQLTGAQKALVTDNNDFAFNLFRTTNRLAEDPSASRILSPISATWLLGMVGNGATGDTQQQLYRTLGFDGKTMQEVNELCQAMLTQAPNLDKQVTLEVANAVYVNKDFTLKPQFKADLAKYYQADAQTADFAAPNFLSTINGWASRHTHGMVSPLLDKANPNAMSYLLNAVYFQAKWTKQFDAKNTRTEAFTREDGSTAQLPMMHNNALVQATTTDTYTMVCLPYGSGTAWNMMVMLPHEGKTVADVLATLNASSWKQALGQGRPVTMDIQMPKFDTATKTDLIEAMRQLGVTRLFDPAQAELSNMCEQGNLFVSNMLQKARISVDEEGSKATAVTVAETGFTSIGPTTPPETGEFHANRPFVYVISENNSDAVFFIGTFMGR